MADEIFQEFAAELGRFRAVLQALDGATALCRFPPLPDVALVEEPLDFFNAAREQNEKFRSALGGVPAVRGAMYVQAISRFESFVRLEIEALAVRASTNAASYSCLPREMRVALISQAALVLGNPAKYRMDKETTTIAKTLADNLADKSAPGEINYRCISLTNENMRASTVSDVFQRLGIKDVWTRIGNNSDLQTHLEIPDAGQASSSSQTLLNVAVEQRNNLTHYNESVTWPSDKEVIDLIDFLTALGEAISKLIPVYELHMKQISNSIAKEREKKADVA